VEHNGMEWSGIEWSGMRWSGMKSIFHSICLDILKRE
jgi:hypothetical protein